MIRVQGWVYFRDTAFLPRNGPAGFWAQLLLSLAASVHDVWAQIFTNICMKIRLNEIQLGHQT